MLEITRQMLSPVPKDVIAEVQERLEATIASASGYTTLKVHGVEVAKISFSYDFCNPASEKLVQLLVPSAKQRVMAIVAKHKAAQAVLAAAEAEKIWKLQPENQWFLAKSNWLNSLYAVGLTDSEKLEEAWEKTGRPQLEAIKANFGA